MTSKRHPLEAIVCLPLLLAACPATPSEDDEGDGTDGTEGSEGSDGGEEQFCRLDQTGPDEPWFTVEQGGQVLGQGSPLEVVCGWQGAFMVETFVSLGGFVPESDSVPFQVTLDVEGFNLGPSGHFASSTVNLFVGCCDEYYGCYYETTSLILFPPDSIADKSVLHGVPGTLTVTMDIPEGPVEQVLDVEMWAVPDDMWMFCSYEYYPVEPLGASGEIPL